MPEYPERIRNIEVYGRIRDYIGGYLRVSPDRGLFPDPFYQDPSPDAAIVAPPAPPPAPPPPPPPPPPHSRVHSPRKSLHKSPHKLSPKKTQVSPLVGYPPKEEYERFVSGYTISHKPQSPVMPGGSRNKKIKKSIKLKKSRKPVKTKLVKMLKTKKNKNHNRVRRNRRYRL
jgi:hypothetical protein